MQSYPEYQFENLWFNQTELLFCGTQQCPPNHFAGPSIRNHMLMVFIHGGKGIFQTRGKTWQLGAGATFFVFPQEVTLYRADSEDPWRYSWVGFRENPQEAFFSKLLKQNGIDRNTPIHIAEDGRELNRLYHSLFHRCTDGTEVSSIKILSIFLDILYQYSCTKNTEASFGELSGTGGRMEPALEYIRQNYGKGISVSDVAAFSGLSREHFCRLFRESFGIPPVRFLREYRLKMASVFLATTNESITSVAERTGFSDYNYFSGCFSSLYGMSPRQYRQQVLKGVILPDPFESDRKIERVAFSRKKDEKNFEKGVDIPI